MSLPQSSRPRAPSLIREIWVRKGSVITIAVLATASAVYYSSQQPPIYAAESRVLVSPINLQGPGAVPAGPSNMATEQEIARSAEVARLVRDRLGLDVPAKELIEDLSIDNPSGTEILVFTFTQPNPAVAREGAQAFAEEYVRLRLRGAEQTQLQAAQERQAKIDALTERLNRIDSRIGRTSNDSVLASLIPRANLLTGLLVQQKQELLSLQTPPDVGELLQPAVALGRDEASYPRDVAVALVLGLTLGVAQAALRGRLDDKLRSLEEAELYLESDAIALIPSLPKLEQQRSTISLSPSVPTSISEAFVPLRVGFLASAARHGATAIVVTSASAGEGRSTVSANLGVSLARTGQRITLIGASPGSKGVEELLAARTNVGLIPVLQGSAPLSQALLPTRIRNLSLLPCGRSTGDDAELFGSASMHECIDSIRERSDFVLVDGPHLGDANAIALLPLADAVLFVVDARHMHTRRLVVARRQLDRGGAELLGVVFNRANPSVVRPGLSTSRPAVSSA